MSLPDTSEQLATSIVALRASIDALLTAAAAEIVDELGGTAVIATADEYGDPYVSVTLVGADGPARQVKFGVPDRVAAAAAQIESAMLLDLAASHHPSSNPAPRSRTITV